jgi:homoserine dehydrogenase
MSTRYLTIPRLGDRTLRVTLLGLGTVGLDCFEVVGIAVRDLEKHPEAPRELLSTNLREILEIPSDIIVELVGGLEPATDLMRAALDSGRDVVTANKEVIARHGTELERKAAARGARLLYAASVCGQIPIIETVQRAGRKSVRYIQGIMNGTTNYILDRISSGSSFDSAVRAAQEAGFAEADPTKDLDGSDAACKLAILTRIALGVDLHPDQIKRRGIFGIDASSAPGVRLVAESRRTADGVQAEVGPRKLPADHPLASVRGEFNRVLIGFDGLPPVVLTGKGAGRWPTAQAVLADLVQLYRLRRSQPGLTRFAVVG